MATRVVVTEELLDGLWDAQRRHHVRLLGSAGAGYGVDEWGDYVASSFMLTEALFDMQWGQTDLARLDAMLNVPDPYPAGVPEERPDVPVLSRLAYGAVCEAIINLDCPALPIDA